MVRFLLACLLVADANGNGVFVSASKCYEQIRPPTHLKHRILTSFGPNPSQVRHLANVGFEQVGSTLYGQPRNNVNLETRFGDGVAISNNGLRLAVGAPGHDDPAGTGSGGNGGLFVYDFNATTSGWTQSAAYLGNDGEKLGLRFAMSADGSRLAIRRNPGMATSSVIVYSAVTKSQLGNVIPGCVFEADAVSISPDGNRLAVSCEKFSTVNPTVQSVGTVDLYEWNASTSIWESFGSIAGGTANSFFGTATSFDASGSRLAVSAVLYDGSTLRPGAVFVYQRNTSAGTWTQMGVRVDGVLHHDRFGATLALSADGTTLVVGAPTHKPVATNTIDGYVAVFELVNNAWVQKGSILYGPAGESFGRSVSVSADGSRFAASASLANNDAGLVRTYEYQTATASWIQVNGDIESLGTGDRLGYDQKGIAMTANGLRIVVGASLGDNGSVETGHARVFDTFLSRSASPSISPRTPSDASQRPSTESNTAIQSPSTATNAPVPPSTTTPTVVPGKFDWDLERVGPVIAVFTDETNADEIMLTYLISHRTAVVTIFDITCKNLVTPQVVSVSQTTNITSSTQSLLSIALDIDQETVVTSSVWKDGRSTGEGMIEVCVRVDLVLDDTAFTSVNFHEQKLYLSIGLSQGFTVSQIDLERDAADETSEEAQVDFGITSCQCSVDRKCANDVLVQGDDAFICVFAPSDGDVEISAIEELDFTQGTLTVQAVQNSTSDALTAVFLFGKAAVVRTQLRSDFFDAVNPANIIARGKVSVRFGSGRRRNLRFDVGRPVMRYHVSGPRRMQEQVQEEQTGFSVNIKLASLDSTGGRRDGVNSGAIVGGVVGGLAGVAFIVALLFIGRRRRNSEKERVDSPLDS